MKTKLQLLALLAISFGLNANAQLSSNPDKFLGNITTSYNVDYGNEAFHTLWNQITCENETKWASVEGTNDRFNWNDAAYNYAKKWNFPFKFHAFVWGSQYPSWIESMTPEERYEEIVEWMDNAKQHYPDLKIIDVVNEAIDGHQSGTKYFIEALGGTGETGYDWIIKAFELAYERWPEAILIYNDFNTFQWNTDQYISLVKALRNAGAPIDAYGCQSHDLTDISFASFKNVMTKLQDALKMPMYSTEYDIGTADDDKQLKQYQDQIPYMWEQDYCAGVTLWGYIYGKTWTTDGNSGIIRNGQDRPAMTWLREYMQTDAAKNAKSPFPGMKKEASIYMRPVYLKIEQNKDAMVSVRTRMETKTIEKIDLYVKGQFVGTMTEAPYMAKINLPELGNAELKAIVTCTDGTTYERYSSVEVVESQTPYKGVIELPGVIEGENYDKGKEWVAYHDSSSDREGSATASYRRDAGPDVDKTPDGGYALGATKKGEWVEYTVNVKEAGVYAITTKYSATKEGASYNLSIVAPEGLKSLTDGDITVHSTGSKSTYNDVYNRVIVPLEAGEQVIRLTITGGDDNVLNIDNMTFEHINVNEDLNFDLTNDDEEYMYSTPAVFTADINAENVQDVKFFVDGILKETDTEAPYEFTLIPEFVGDMTISAYATAQDGTQSDVASRTINVGPLKGPYKGIKQIPGYIEAEDFNMGGEGLSFHDSDNTDKGNINYRSDNEGVDIIAIGDGYGIGYTEADEWLDYTAEVAIDGKYSVEAVVSAAATGSTIKVGFVEGNNVSYLRAMSVPETGAGTYTTVKCKSTKELTAGEHTVRLYINSGGCNIDKLIFRDVESAGIEDATVDDSESNQTYNITGQRVSEKYKGVVIKNGKKFFKK